MKSKSRCSWSDGYTENTNETIEITLQPNPTAGMLTIHNLPRDGYFVITNPMGEIVMRLHCTTEFLNVDLSSIPAGIYFVSTSFGRCQKLIKQ